MKRLDLYQVLLTTLLVAAFPVATFASSPTAECGAVEMPYQIDGTYQGQWLGYSVAGVGDVNGDGKADFLVGGNGGITGNGDTLQSPAYVYSGLDGALLFELSPQESLDGMGEAVAGAGDVNGDGKPDFICGAPVARPTGAGNTGSAYVFSGMDGSLLYRVNGTVEDDALGASVSGGWDVNGDGIADFIVGAPDNNLYALNRPGYAQVYSGADGSLMYSLTGENIADRFGYSVALFGDLNGDGKSEFGAGARWTDLNGHTQVGSVYVYSGADGSLMYRKDGADGFDNFGWSMANAGDINNDGKPDFVVGAVTADPGGRSSAGAAYVYSGVDGSFIRRLDGLSSGDHFAYSVAGAGDINGDGFADIMVGAPDVTSSPVPSMGAAYVFSGHDGSLLYQIISATELESVGWSVAGLGDADGDGRGDFLVATPAASFTTGWVRVFKSGSMFADINSDGRYTPTDVVSLLKTVFLGAPLPCPDCAADVNCDGVLTSSDAVVELNAVFLAAPVFCVL